MRTSARMQLLHAAHLALCRQSRANGVIPTTYLHPLWLQTILCPGRRMARRVVGGQVRLRDGRALALREYGSAIGLPIIFTHGNLNSRLFEPVWDLTQEVSLHPIQVHLESLPK